jgi:RimJ/RimL family protein N-acetyltransferase
LANGELVLRTPRLVLSPLVQEDEAEHAHASGRLDDAKRDTSSAEAHWRDHEFGLWAIRDEGGEFLGVAELHLAGEGIEGIAPDEIEAGWWVTESRRNEGIATEAMSAAIADLWARTDAGRIAAYIDPDNVPSHRVAAKLGFVVRGPGRGRSGEPMVVVELLRAG